MIYLDSRLLIYLLEAHSVHGARVRAAMGGRDDFAISPLVQLECLVEPLADANFALRQAYEGAFERLALLPMTEAVFRLAAELRASFRLEKPDALHLACALHHRCDALWTGDDRLARASRGFARNILAQGG